MGEKKGHLVKLYYDFDTAAVMEIFLRNKTWYRVTSREFRSFDGRRRITKPERTQGRGEIYNMPMITTEYEGPVFMWGTNNHVPYLGTGTMVESDTSEYFQKQYELNQSGSNVRV